MLGFEPGHTVPCVTSFVLKSAAWASENLRKTLVGRALHPRVLVWFLRSWAFAVGLTDVWPPLAACFAREGHLACQGPELEDDEAIWRGWTVEERLIVEHLRGVDHRGSDVRLDTGQLMTPSSWPRRALKPKLWKWGLKVKWKWTWDAHINVLEARAVLAAMRWRLRRASSIGSRFLHLLDSQVSQAVLSKRRSSSGKLNCVCRRIGALELAAHVLPLYGFTRSDENPADAPSRGSEAPTRSSA
jgi:hypothetical protein